MSNKTLDRIETILMRLELLKIRQEECQQELSSIVRLTQKLQIDEKKNCIPEMKESTEPELYTGFMGLSI